MAGSLYITQQLGIRVTQLIQQQVKRRGFFVCLFVVLLFFVLVLVSFFVCLFLLMFFFLFA